jgi:hypothetical protein
MIMRRIKKVEADAKALTLSITWANGARTFKDMAPLIKRKSLFKPLANPKVFARAQPIDDGRVLGWGSSVEAEIDADALWYQAHPDENPFPEAVMTPAEFRAWMARCGYSLETAAGALDMSRRMIAHYSAGTKTIPRVVWLACIALEHGLRGHRTAAE